MPETFVKMSDQLADLIGAERGSAVSDQHGTFAGGKHAYVVVEGGEVKLVVLPTGEAVPDDLKASTWHEPIASPVKLNASFNDLATAAIRYAKAIGG